MIDVIEQDNIRIDIINDSFLNHPLYIRIIKSRPDEDGDIVKDVMTINYRSGNVKARDFTNEFMDGSLDKPYEWMSVKLNFSPKQLYNSAMEILAIENVNVPKSALGYQPLETSVKMIEIYPEIEFSEVRDTNVGSKPDLSKTSIDGIRVAAVKKSKPQMIEKGLSIHLMIPQRVAADNRNCHGMDMFENDYLDLILFRGGKNYSGTAMWGSHKSTFIEKESPVSIAKLYLVDDNVFDFARKLVPQRLDKQDEFMPLLLKSYDELSMGSVDQNIENMTKYVNRINVVDLDKFPQIASTLSEVTKYLVEHKSELTEIVDFYVPLDELIGNQERWSHMINDKSDIRARGNFFSIFPTKVTESGYMPGDSTLLSEKDKPIYIRFGKRDLMHIYLTEIDDDVHLKGSPGGLNTVSFGTLSELAQEDEYSPIIIRPSITNEKIAVAKIKYVHLGNEDVLLEINSFCNSYIK